MIIIGITIIAVLVLCILYLRCQNQDIIEFNEANLRKNLELEQELSARQQELKNVGENIESQTQILRSLEQTNEELRSAARSQADQEYAARVAALSADYNQRYSSLDLDFKAEQARLIREISAEKDKLEDLKAKQLAYIQAKLREEEIRAKEDYYKLGISDADKQDIELLRSIQKQFAHKEAIDKLIWDGYYKPAYDTLMSHLFKSANKTSGIYRITNLVNGQSYIGQSVDVRERLRQHIKSAISSAPATNRLYQAMKKDGLWNFTFELLEEVPKDKLNERETYYIELYQTKNFGMNKTAGGA